MSCPSSLIVMVLPSFKVPAASLKLVWIFRDELLSQQVWRLDRQAVLAALVFETGDCSHRSRFGCACRHASDRSSSNHVLVR